MLSEFENYDIAAWSIDGVTRHVRSLRDWSHNTFAKQKLAITLACAVTLGAASPSHYGVGGVQGTTTRAAIIGSRELGPTSLRKQRDVISGSPSKFWSDVSTQVGSWKTVEESELPEFPPFL